MFAGLVMLMPLVAGCQSTGGSKYTFRDMPPELVAVRRENAQTLDLQGLAQASANSNVIDRGDVIEVAISAGLDEKDTVRLPVRVGDDGIAPLPEIGPVALAGMEMEAAEATIVRACIERQLYRRPNVTVTMKKQRVNRVTVIGAVEKPDVYELPRGRCDLFAALVAAKGLAKDAGTIVEIRNPNRPTGSRRDPVASGGLGGINTVGVADGSAESAATAALDTESTTGGPLRTIRIDLVSATKSGTGDYLLSISKNCLAGGNTAPLALNESYNTPVNTTLAIGIPGVLENDSDADGDVLFAVLASGTAHGTLSLDFSGAFTYTPMTNFVGQDSFTYRASDGVATSAVASVTISVLGSVASLQFSQDTYVVAENGGSFNITVTRTGPTNLSLNSSGMTMPPFSTLA